VSREVLDVRGIPIEGHIYIVNTIALFVKGLLSRDACPRLQTVAIPAKIDSRGERKRP
jgi:hypothetical protein